jgi:ribose transport system substrate-binding protein
MYTHRLLKVAVGIVASVTVLAGCSATSTDDSGSSGDSSKVSSEVKDAVTAAKELPSFEPPGDAIDPSSLKGKKVFEIPSVANPFVQSISDTMKGVAGDYGLKYTVFENQSQVSQWVQGMDQAIRAKVDLIILNGAPDPRALQPQLQEAEKAKIPVLVVHFHDDGSVAPPDCEGCNGGVAGLVTAPFYSAGVAAADWIIEDSGASAKVLIVGGSDILPSPGTIKAMKKEFTDKCPDCETKVINIPVADWNTKTQGEVQSALQSDPSITYVYLLYDAMVAGAVPAVETLGKGGKVKITSYNGSPFALDYIRKGDVVAMNVGEDTVGIGYASMDQAFRILLGKPTVKTSTPIRIWDDSNVKDAGDPAKSGQGYGDAFPEGYRKLWGG